MYAKDGAIEYLDYTFADSSYIEGLDVNGRGYINCVRLTENRYFVDSYLPT